MKISLKIIESERDIALKIANALIPDVRKFMSKAMDVVKKELPSIVNNAIINTPEYASLSNGKLRYEFGIPDVQQKLAGLLNIWSQTVSVVYSPPVISGGGQIRSKFSASMIKVDFSDVLFTEYAEVYDNERGYKLPWLQWLLLEGNKTIVSNYSVVIGPNKKSRTGFAIMRPTSKAWKVPSEFSGTQNDNWITRAIDQTEDQVNQLLQKALGS